MTGGRTDVPLIRSEQEYQQTLQEAQRLAVPALSAVDLGNEPTPIQRADLETAEKMYEGIVAYKPTAFGPHATAGRIDQVLGDADRAIVHFQQAMLNKPANPSADTRHVIAVTHYFFSLALFDRQLYGDAAAEARIALLTDPKNPDFLTALASALLQKGTKDGAETAVQKALAIKPDHKRAKQLDGLIHAGQQY